MNKAQFKCLLIYGLTLFFFANCSNSDNSENIMGSGVFYTPSGSATIEGELFLPSGQGPFPTMILIPGSGNEPREGLEVVVNLLLPNGYAVYIYDKRGIGGSTGAYPQESPENMENFLNARAQDVLGILELLKRHSELDKNRIGLFGSSQGAWVNSLVYREHSSLSYIINASGGVASTGIESFYCSLTDDPNVTIAEATDQLYSYTGPLGFDPISIIRSMSIPVLWIYGNEDRSHPSRYDVAVLNNLQMTNFEVQLYQNVNHELVDLNTMQSPIDLYENIGAWLETNN